MHKKRSRKGLFFIAEGWGGALFQPGGKERGALQKNAAKSSAASDWMPMEEGWTRRKGMDDTEQAHFPVAEK